MSKRCVLVTGSTSGIGLAITRARLELGDTVIGIGRDHSKARLSHDTYHPVTLDIANAESVIKGIRDILKAWPELDVVVSNAGYGSFDCIENYSTKQIEDFFRVNLLAHVFVARAVILI